MPYVLATWSSAKVNIDYDVAVEKHYYSMPHMLVHQQVEVWLNHQMVKFFIKAKRIAVHARSFRPGLFTTLVEHRPKSQ